jgi:hypothetical protein
MCPLTARTQAATSPRVSDVSNVFVPLVAAEQAGQRWW